MKLFFENRLEYFSRKKFIGISWVSYAVLIGLVVSVIAVRLIAQPIFRSGIDLVYLGVTATDAQGNLLTDLTVDDFEVYEEGERQTIRYFMRGGEVDDLAMPLHLGLLLDMSGSMDQDEHFTKTAAIKFLNSLVQAADMTLVDFDSEVRVGRYGQADFPRLVERIRNTKPGGRTVLYDALGVYLDGAFTQDGQKILLLYTDGDDTHSRMSFGETLDLIKASDVTIYAIGFQKHMRASSRVVKRMRLLQLVEESGGICFFPESIEDLSDIYEQIKLEIMGRYYIGYSTIDEQTDGTWRQVEVKLRDGRADLERVKLRTRKGYFSLYKEPSR